ncbi:MAG: winged helix-turn-helix transcriptional regulator, partial [Nanoarchaeota archaeon]|nr:winged helix-turn-helix transcriptional regulator [Nanoarchaeota archaeon]
MTLARVIVPERTEEKEISLDIKDRKIIEVLSRNSRTPITRLAKILGYSKEVVKYRIDKLVKDNVITDFYAVVESSKLGYDRFNLYLEFYTLTREDENMIVEYLLKHPNISWVITTSGKWDFMI